MAKVKYVGCGVLGVRIRTASLLRSIDRLKDRFHARNLNFVNGIGWFASLAVSSGKSTFLTLLLLIGFVLHFAAFQFEALVLLGFCTVQLLFCRAANAFFRFFRI
ncbi:MAG: hypothetical protein JRN52_03510 [Nitrososphaerota archaeon]|nr:hypothetical protein [Nitrososphaerota archaeon]